jgi:hypothetical protein
MNGRPASPHLLTTAPWCVHSRGCFLAPASAPA